MCLQCLTKAVTVKKDILPGYILKKARLDYVGQGNSPSWLKGQFGLIKMNNPDFVWTNPGVNPIDGLTDRQINSIEESKWKRAVEWMKKVEIIEKNFKDEPMICYEFIRACKKAGYRPARHGLNAVMWFVNHCAKAAKRRKHGTRA